MNDRRPPYRLNVGCGRNIQPGWINLDTAALPGVDLVCDLDGLRQAPIGLPDSCVEAFLVSHVLEHVRDTLGLMEELWRLALPGATCVVRVPHGGSDDAWEDPTHRRAYFPGSFGFFAQPYYFRADYGYRGDWQPEVVHLLVDRARCAGLDAARCLAKSRTERNVVREMVCDLRAVKPRREPLRELYAIPKLAITLVD